MTVEVSLEVFYSVIPFLKGCGLSRARNPLLESITFRPLFVGWHHEAYDSDTGSDRYSTTSEGPIMFECPPVPNLVDEALVEFVERMGIKTVSIEYLTRGPAPGDVRKTLEKIFPQLRSKGYLQLAYSSVRFPSRVWCFEDACDDQSPAAKNVLKMGSFCNGVYV